jgi:putative ATP-dependent endonuclease of OLD family
MKITSLKISNFRCFGPEVARVSLSETTCLVGTNGSGKSAVLVAISKLFGLSESERTVVKSDFHISCESDDEEPDELSLSIEARIEFPELGELEDLTSLGVPEFFNQMIVEDVGSAPFCRVRLEAKWFATSLTDGDVEQKLYWITTPEGETEEEKHPMSALQRSQIHAIYVPAARDPSRQLRSARGSTFGRLLRSVQWSKKIRSTLEDSAQEVLDAFGDEPAIQKFTEVIRANWNELQNLTSFEDPTVRPLNPKFENLVRNLEFVFNPDSEHQQNQLDNLSEGLQSLFYLALVGMMFDLEELLLEKPVEGEEDDSQEDGRQDQEDQDEEEEGEGDEESAKDDADGHGISLRKLNPPSLVILSIEEPENHLAPHYLGRIMERLLRLSKSPRGQVLLSSHSPSIMSRIEPAQVRYLRLNSENESEVHEILLPSGSDEAFKYVNDAVRAHPQLYFSTLVVLGEGDSESVVLPRLAGALGVPLDRNFVSFIPLGGRHVNHFWKLLSDLRIPYITLLDLDLGREGGGWGRIKYACKELLRLGKDRKKLLEVVNGEGKKSVLSDTELEKMHTWEIDKKEHVEHLGAWRTCLEEHDVFFSYPLDLDFALLRKFSGVYKKVVPNSTGPSIPEAGTKTYNDKLSEVVKSIFKSGGSDSPAYKISDQEFFFWYRYLFLGRGKPTTHFQAMAIISPPALAEDAPSVLKRLIKKMHTKLNNEEQS